MFSQIWSILCGKEQNLGRFCLGGLLKTDFLIDSIPFVSFAGTEV